MTDKIKVGVIGLGRISSLHLNAYKETNGIHAELTAICDKNKKTLKQVAKEYNLSLDQCFTDYQELLNSNNVDAVEILVPHHLHEKTTIDALNNGKHVSLQKVPAMTLCEMDNMTTVARKNNLHFRVFENFRFHEPYMKAMELIKQGVIGETERIDYRMYAGVKTLSAWHVPLKANAWRITEKANYKAPTLFDDGYHKHSVIAWMLQEPIESIIAWQGKFNLKLGRIPTPIHWDTPASIIYICKNKSHYATWSTSLHHFLPMHSDYYPCDEYMDIIGEKGAIFIPGCTGSWYKEPTSGPGQEGIHWCTEDGKWHSDTSMNSDWAQSFINCSAAFIDGIKDNHQSALSPNEARYILKIALATVKSTREQYREVQLDEIINSV